MTESEIIEKFIQLNTCGDNLVCRKESGSENGGKLGNIMHIFVRPDKDEPGEKEALDNIMIIEGAFRAERDNGSYGARNGNWSHARKVYLKMPSGEIVRYYRTDRVLVKIDD